MRAIINGKEGVKIGAYKGAALTLKVHLINDDGSPLDLTGGTVAAIIYDTKDRRNALIDSQAGVLTTPTAGFVTVSYLAADMTFGPSTNNVPYWIYIKYTETGGLEYVGLIPAQLTIK